MATKIMKSAILPASRYKDDWLSHRNLKNHGSGVNYNTRAFAKSQGSLMLRIATKNRGPNNLSHLTVFCYFFVFFHQADGALKFNKFSENCENSGLQWFVAFYDFSLIFCFSYTYLAALSNSTNSEKIARIRGRHFLPHFTIFLHFFVVLNLPERASDFN